VRLDADLGAGFDAWVTFFFPASEAAKVAVVVPDTKRTATVAIKISRATLNIAKPPLRPLRLVTWARPFYRVQPSVSIAAVGAARSPMVS
jgi:hypothetical protein